MLHIILGRVSGGKTTYLHKQIGMALDKSESDAVLIVPEQFTFETDRGILDTLGPVKSNRVEVYSFTRLAEALFEECGYDRKPVITEQSRLIFMARALSEVQDRLEVFRKHIDDKAFIGKMVLVVNEFRQSAAEAEHMHKVVDSLPEGMLKSKMNELMLICDAYDAIVSRYYTDTADVLTNLYELLLEKNLFRGRTVAIDGFASFNAQILKIIGRIMAQCDELYITLTADSLYYTEGQNDVFAFTRRTASHLRALADKVGVRVAAPVIIDEETTGFSPYASECLKKLERDFYSPFATVCTDKTDDINIYCAADIEDECAFTARKIRKLNREGVRCRDITVIYRDEEKYETKLKAAFRKYEVPVFEDRREPIDNQPIILFVRSVLKICAGGFSTENMMKLLKTGLSPLSTQEIAELENYVYMWQIDGAKWKNEWSFNPNGFSENKTDKNRLKIINKMRSSVTDPLVSLREEIKNKDGEEISAAIYNFLRETGTDMRLKELAISLEEDGEITLALEQEQIWDMLMETLNECALSLKGIEVSAEKYLDMFDLSLSVRTLGRVPNGIDEVTVGAASRIKTRNTKIVFVLGLNAGVFPAVAGNGGLLSDKDKTILLQNGLELFDLNKYKSIEEKFIAYNAVCRAREKVYLSYALRGGPGDDKKTPSEIITFISKQFPNAVMRTTDELTTEEKIEGRQAAFELLAEHFRENGYYSKNLLAYFSALPEYENRIEALRRAAGGTDFRFKNPEVSKELFGMKMYLSATRVERYETCPFSYFCQYGMGAEPRKRAVLDPSQSGTIVHYVLEKLVEFYRDTGIQNVPKGERSLKIKEFLSAYAENNMGGLGDKESRFSYHFNRLAKILDTLLDRIVSEFEDSSFTSCDFELEIGGKSEIPAYRIKLSDGGEIKIHGSVDRVDEFNLDGTKYLRVVDYKTGQKEMELSDVMSGLNMQMFIYLFALMKNGKKHFGDNIAPAGVLYFPARYSPFAAERTDGETEIESRILKGGKMNGIVLNDSRIVKAMEDKEESVFIPVTFDSKTGKMKGNLMSLPQFEVLRKRIDTSLSEMALSLHSGNIAPNPVSGKNHEKTCDNCPYISVCGHEKDGRYRKIDWANFNKCLEALEGGEE